MKIYELLYISAIFLILLSIIIYFLSTTVITTSAEDTLSNFLGETTKVDSTYAATEVLPDVVSMQRHRSAIYLWLGIPLGVLFFLIGLIIKRKTEGKDLFLDDEINDDEVDFPFY